MTRNISFVAAYMVGIVLAYSVAKWLCFGSLTLNQKDEGNTYQDQSCTQTNYIQVFKTNVNQYPIVHFNASVDNYSTFIDDLLGRLVTGDVRYGIPVMRSREVDIDQRFILLQLTNSNDQTVTLAMDVTNAYVVGFLANNRAYFFRPNREDADSITHLFPNAVNHNTFSFTANYNDLEGIGGNRQEIALGMEPLEEAILNIHLYGVHENNLPSLIRSLLVCIQMISEAIRFPYIRREMIRRIEGHLSAVPNEIILRFEIRWGRLSRRIQESNQGAFSSQVLLINRLGEEVGVDHVNRIPGVLALMPYQCPPRQQPQFSAPNFDEDVCESPEPTVHIVGPNGLCVDVTDEYYHDGNPIELWPCKSSDDANQLWTFKNDGTIRSKDKCLTTYGYRSGSYVMIYNCSNAVSEATRWQVQNDGNIVNPKSALVLAGKSKNKGTTLTVESNVYSTGQSWLPSNYMQPYVVSIIGYRGMCLEANGGSVWLDECASNEAKQLWALYADGSIRPKDVQTSCLTSDDGTAGTVVKIAPCSAAPTSGQRWWLRNDGTIWNMYHGMVLDVKQSDPSLKQIIIWTLTKNDNQKWLPEL